MLKNSISFFGGFLTSSLIDTSLGEFSEWAVVGSAVLVATLESFNAIYFSTKNQNKFVNNRFLGTKLLDTFNIYKTGVIYGLIVDAFKLGS